MRTVSIPLGTKVTESFTEHFQQVNKQQFEDLVEQYRLLEEWGKKTFPEVDFRFEFNSDNINRKIKVKTTFLTSNELNPNDRLYKTSELAIPEKDWYNTTLMSKVIKSILPSQIQVISRTINEYYKLSLESANTSYNKSKNIAIN